MPDFVSALKQCKDLFSMTGVTCESINQAKESLNVKFSAEYEAYLLALGVASANGHEFTGLCTSPRLNVVDVTRAEREYNPNVPMDLYVVEQANIDGIVLWQSGTGQIFQTYADRPPILLCDSLCELLEL